VSRRPVPLIRDSAFAERVAEEKQRLVDAGVEYCFASWVDIHGRSKGKCVPVGRFEHLARGSEMYTVQAFEGMGPLGPHEEDQAAVPDLDSLVICPWNTRYAWMASDLYWRGEPYPYCTRTILKRMLAKAASAGYQMMFGVEPEFYVLRHGEDGGLAPFHPGDEGPSWAYDVESTLDAGPLLETLQRYFDGLGWEVSSFDHEGGHSQYEFDFGFAEALIMCDRFTFLRLMLKETVKRFGAFATFMPKPFPDDFRSGAHFNMSLSDLSTGRNLMRDVEDPKGYGFSQVAYHFLAGMLEHAKAITAVCCPTVNSYKGFVSGGVDPSGMLRDMSWAPVYATYGDNNRSAMMRLPIGRDCIENRATDMAVNIYLGAAISLGAGLDALHRRLDPGDPCNRNLYELTSAELAAANIGVLPSTLSDALDAFETDPLTEEVFGAEGKHAYLEVKRAEWRSYHRFVSQWEYDQYLHFF
jgi:glutamine synthetase